MSSPPPIRRVSHWLQDLRRRIEDHFARHDVCPEPSLERETLASGGAAEEDRAEKDATPRGAAATEPSGGGASSTDWTETLGAAYDLLFAERWNEAQAQFRVVMASAARGDEGMAPAALGWLIAAWNSGERAPLAAPLAALTRRLTPGGGYPRETLAGICPDCGQAFRAHRRAWQLQLRCRGCRHLFTPERQAAGGADLSRELTSAFEPEFLLSADDRLLRDLYLWLALARVEELGTRLPQLDVDEWETLRRELEFASLIDPGCSDAPLMAGLIGLCQADAESRAEGRRKIEQALARGASHPVATACLWHAGQLVQLSGPQLTDILWDGTRRLDQLPALSELQQEFRRRSPGRASGSPDAPSPTMFERQPPTIVDG